MNFRLLIILLRNFASERNFSTHTLNANKLHTTELLDHDDSKYVSHVGVEHKEAEFIGNKHTDTQLYIIISTEVLHFTD